MNTNFNSVSGLSGPKINTLTENVSDKSQLKSVSHHKSGEEYSN